MAIININVVADLIQKGQADPNSRTKACAIYLAAKPVVPNLSHISPTHMVLYADNTKGYYAVELPEIAKQFVRMSDTQANVAAGRLKTDPNDVDQEKLKPIRFPVRVPDEHMKPLARKK